MKTCFVFQLNNGDKSVSKSNAIRTFSAGFALEPPKLLVFFSKFTLYLLKIKEDRINEIVNS